jgi:hypothetical protein
MIEERERDMAETDALLEDVLQVVTGLSVKVLHETDHYIEGRAAAEVLAQELTGALREVGWTTGWEWGVSYGDNSADRRFLGYDDEAGATEMLRWLPNSVIVRRQVNTGPWEPAPIQDRSSR